MILPCVHRILYYIDCYSTFIINTLLFMKGKREIHKGKYTSILHPMMFLKNLFGHFMGSEDHDLRLVRTSPLIWTRVPCKYIPYGLKKKLVWRKTTHTLARYYIYIKNVIWHVRATHVDNVTYPKFKFFPIVF